MVKQNKKIKKQNIKKKYSVLVLAVAVFLALIYLITNYSQLFGKEEAAAIVNGETISVKELDKQYNLLPQQYKPLYTKEMVLEQMISMKLLLQEAGRQAITATDSEVAELVNIIANQSSLTREEFISALGKQGFSQDYIIQYYKEQLAISRLLNKTILSKIEIADSEISGYYNLNKLEEQGYKLEDVKGQIEQILFAAKQENALAVYLSQLRSQAEIKIFIKEKEKSETTTFKSTGDEACMEDNKPLVYLFCTAKSPHCEWIRETFNLVMREYTNNNTIAAYNWELDTGDNLLTEATETFIPKYHFALFQKYNPENTVPTYIFGCKYAGVGNAYEPENNLDAEKQEFISVIDKLLS